MKRYTVPELKSLVGRYKDFPVKGINFFDLNPLLYNPNARSSIIADFAKNMPVSDNTVIAAPEARGFIWGSMLAHTLSVPFIPIRKKGKLPGNLAVHSYNLEYGSGELFIQSARHLPGFKKGTGVIIVDDVLATGGTAMACAELVQKIGGKVAAFYFVLGIADLKGADALKDYSAVIRTTLQF